MHLYCLQRLQQVGHFFQSFNEHDIVGMVTVVKSQMCLQLCLQSSSECSSHLGIAKQPVMNACIPDLLLI